MYPKGKIRDIKFLRGRPTQWSKVYTCWVKIFLDCFSDPFGGAMPSRLRRQTTVRRGHVKTIVTKMAQKLRTKKHLKRMESTNRLLPLGSFQRRCVKDIFSGWILDFVGEGRILTKKLVEQVYLGLRKK